MEKPAENSSNSPELPKAEQSAELFSLSEQEKNIQEVFKLCPELKEIACQSLGIENDIKIEIINKEIDKENDELAISVNVYYKGRLIIDTQNEVASRSLLKLNQLKDGRVFVNAVLLPKDLQGAGLYGKILQETANTLNQKITASSLVFDDDSIIAQNAKKVWGKLGGEVSPNHEAERLYAKYLETIFPDSKVQEILFHTTSATFKNFDREYISRGNVSFGEGFYFTDKIETHKNFKGGDKVVPVIVNVDRVYKDSVEEKDQREKPKYNPYVNSHERLLEIQKQHNEFLEKNFDGVIATYNNKNEFVIFEPENIHILGSEDDVEKFKEFVYKSNNI